MAGENKQQHQGKGKKQNYNNNNNNKNQRQEKNDRPKKEAILDLSKYQNKEIRVKFVGGREVTGTLKGYDQLMNLVLDGVKERLRDPDDDTVLLDATRDLGLVVIRGPLLLTIAPVDGSEIIDNPYVVAEE